MASKADDGGRRGGAWRIALWGTAAFLLLLPLVAMQFTDEVRWDETDFIVIGAMLAVACGTIELAARMGSILYRAAVAVAVVAAFLLIWLNLAVGIIGSEDNSANLMFGGVLAFGIVRACIARFRPAGMAVALVAMAFAQLTVGSVALVAGFGSTDPSWPADIVGLTGFFTSLWLISAWLFRKAAEQRLSASAGRGG